MLILLTFSCADLEFDNPVDPKCKGSDCEQTPSSSVGADNHQPSSSSVSQNGSSSSVATPTSSSSQRSSSSVVPSSSSNASDECTNATGNDTFTDYRDGKMYKHVTICNQVWMAENLNYAAEGSKCYDNKESNCDIYGRLYNWVTAMYIPSTCNSTSCSSQVQTKHQGVCPDDWHIPSSNDWNVLIKYIHKDNGLANFTSGTSNYAGKYLKATEYWESYAGVVNEDKYGFAALPGGYGYSDGRFYSAGGRGSGSWWSSTEYIVSYAYYRSMGYSNEDASWFSNSKTDLLSVRCLRD